MMDNIREKLVELIYRAHHNASCVIGYGGSEGEALEEEARYLLAHGVTVQEWIPVTERLPEKSGEYLTYCGDYNGVCVLYYEVLKTKGKWRTRWKEVTHWMPLPAPPKGE